MLNIFSELHNLDFDNISNNIKILETVLSEILEGKVKVVAIIPNTLYYINKNNNVQVIDLAVELNDVKKIIVELNISFDKYFKVKHLPYKAFEYLDSLDEDMDIVQISLNFSKDTKEVVKKTYYFISEETNEILTESFKLIEVIVPKSNN